jgi:ABC-type uncharacterized transport system auxiliary subunit
MSHRPWRRLALTGFVTLLQAACFRGTLPALEHYRVALPEPVPRVSSTPLLGGTVAILPYVAPGLYGRPRIVYRIGDHEYGAYPSREWAIPLGEMLGMLTEQLASADGLAPTVTYDPPSRRSHSYLWRGTVRQFEEVDRGNAVLAAVRLDVQLIRTADDSVVWTGSAGLERPVAAPEMREIVRTLSELTGDAVRELMRRMRVELSLRGEPGSRRP